MPRFRRELFFIRVGIPLVLWFLVAALPAAELPAFHFGKPDAVYVLPGILSEISGFVPVGDGVLACVQDNKGALFFYDTAARTISATCSFGPDGDYEGIAMGKGTVFVLRSDGVVFEIRDYTKTWSACTRYDTGIACADSEGLCYDPSGNRLLIACKGDILTPKTGRSKRAVYAFDLSTRALSPKPAFELNVDHIDSKLVDSRHDHTKKKDETEKLEIRFSDIAVHPFLPLVYLLSARDQCLVIFDANGRLVRIERLDPLLFNKPEGIAFSVTGDLFVSNEGENKNATILFFKH